MSFRYLLSNMFFYVRLYIGFIVLYTHFCINVFTLLMFVKTTLGIPKIYFGMMSHKLAILKKKTQLVAQKKH